MFNHESCLSAKGKRRQHDAVGNRMLILDYQIVHTNFGHIVHTVPTVIGMIFPAADLRQLDPLDSLAESDDEQRFEFQPNSRMIRALSNAPIQMPFNPISAA